MQPRTEKASPLKKVKSSGSTNEPPGDFITKRIEFGKVARGRETSDRTTIQISQGTKSDLDRIKKESSVKTYDAAIRFLLEGQRMFRPSMFGLLSGAGPFVRDEGEDSHRIRS